MQKDKNSVASKSKTSTARALLTTDEVTDLVVEPAAPTGPFAKFEFEEESYDFGDIKQGDIVKHAFKFKNVGETDLVITKIDVTCGCTTPNWTKEPIGVGEEGEILVQFNSKGKRGGQNKVVTIMANVEGGKKKIVIKTNVEADPISNAMGPVKGK